MKIRYIWCMIPLISSWGVQASDVKFVKDAEAKIAHYDQLYCGLQNTGVICWYNAATQLLRHYYNMLKAQSYTGPKYVPVDPKQAYEALLCKQEPSFEVAYFYKACETLMQIQPHGVGDVQNVSRMVGDLGRGKFLRPGLQQDCSQFIGSVMNGASDYRKRMLQTDELNVRYRQRFTCKGSSWDSETFATKPYHEIGVPLCSGLMQEFEGAAVVDELACGIHKGKCDGVSKKLLFEHLPTIMLVNVQLASSMSNMNVNGVKKDFYKVPCAINFRKLSSVNLQQQDDAYFQYELCGFVAHRGSVNNIDSGHWVSFLRHGNQWFLYDDNKITEIDTHVLEFSLQTNGRMMGGYVPSGMLYRRIADFPVTDRVIALPKEHVQYNSERARSVYSFVNDYYSIKFPYRACLAFGIAVGAHGLLESNVQISPWARYLAQGIRLVGGGYTAYSVPKLQAWWQQKRSAWGL